MPTQESTETSAPRYEHAKVCLFPDDIRCAEALETLEREHYIDLARISDARTAIPCDEDIAVFKGARYERGIARAEREMRGASDEHTLHEQRMARPPSAGELAGDRSEERRVGKECV